MKKTIISLVAFTAMLLPSSLLAQQASMASFTKLMEVSSNFSAYTSMSDEQIKALSPDKSEEAVKKAKEYLAGDFVNDLAEISYPYYTELTDADCNALVAAYNTPEIKTANEHMLAFNILGSGAIQRSLMAGMQKVISGEEAEPVKIDKVSPDFIKAFEAYDAIVDLNGTVSLSLSSVVDAMKAMGQGGELIDKLVASVKKNIKNSAILAMESYVTVDDLNRFVALYSTTAGQHFVAGNKALSADAIGFSMKFSQKIMDAVTK